MKDANGENQYAVEPFVEHEEASEETAEATLMRLGARYNLNRAVCLEMIDEVIKAFGAPAPRVGGLNELRQLNSRFREAIHILIAYQANQKTLADVQISPRVMAYVLGFKTAAGAETIADMARQFGVKKQTPNKCKMNFRQKLGMPADDGDRDEDACEKMKQARQNQLTKKKHD